MTRDELQTLLRKEPFQPFRVRLHDDTIHEIRHPRMAMVSSYTLYVGVPRSGSTEPVAESVEHVSLVSIRDVELFKNGAPLNNKNSMRGIAMNQTELVKVLREVPFRPFRIKLSGNDYYDIRHPDLAIVTPSAVHIGITSPTAAHPIAQDTVIVSLNHVIQIEYLTATASAQGGSQQNTP